MNSRSLQLIRYALQRHPRANKGIIHIRWCVLTVTFDSEASILTRHRPMNGEAIHWVESVEGSKFLFYLALCWGISNVQDPYETNQGSPSLLATILTLLL